MKVIIVGAGVAGLGIGWRLRRRGVAVTILDRAQPGQGASWAAAGMIAPAGELAGAPPEEVALARDAAAAWPDFAAELEQASGMAIGYRRDGALFVGNAPPGLETLTCEQGRALVPELAATEPLHWAPDEARVDNRALSLALAVAFERAGGRILANEAVVEFDGSAVRTPFGLHAADAVVIAAGAWSALLDVPLTPVKGQIIALEPPPGSGAPSGPVIWGNGIYAVPREDRLLVGATVEQAGFDTTTDPQAADDLRVRATVLLPGLAGWTLAGHWAGLRPKSPDGLPLLGPWRQPGLFVAGGQYRNGILFAPAIAAMMADIVLGAGDVIPVFDPRRFA